MAPDPERPEQKLQSIERRRLAEAVRAACLQAALESYEDARLDGLCEEGAWECAVDAIRSLDIEAVIRRAVADSQGRLF